MRLTAWGVGNDEHLKFSAQLEQQALGQSEPSKGTDKAQLHIKDHLLQSIINPVLLIAH